VRIVKNWQHFHDFLGTPLVRDGREEAFWTAVLRHLDAADWAPGFVYFTGLVEGGPVHAGLRAAARALGRACPTVHRAVRAELASDLSPQAYYESRVRKKKRKELGRLRHRLDELGEVRTRIFAPGEAVEPWCDAFLALERSGWKGEAGTALACAPDTERFFREALSGAAAAGRLECLRMEVGGRPIAMLVNFITPPGAFSFKIAFDEDFARFSPGVLIQLENLAILERDDIAWMDSCAVENHPMIDSLWSERRPVIRVSVRLKGARRSAIYFTCRALETASARLRGAARAARRLSARGSMA
jgi:CelD/BcsL family acetyltransferase involved in cellulose biosynthesis